MASKSNVLLLFTQMYPFGKEETFLEDEIEIIKEKFDEIYIITNSTENYLRKIPKGLKVIQLSFNQFSYKNLIKIFFNKFYWVDLLSIFKNNPLNLFSLGIHKTLIYSVLNSTSLSKNILELINKRIDINKANLFFYSYWINDFALAFIYLKNKVNGKFFCRAHGWDIFLNRSKYQFLPLRKVLPCFLDKIYFISKTGCDYYKVNYGQYDNLAVAKLGVNSYAKNINNEIIDKNELTILSCSLIIPLKRIDLIIISLSELNNIKYKWYHIGYDTNDGILTNQLEELANELNVNFEFIGYMPNKDVHSFYENKQVDLFLNLSNSEGLPVSIMEAYSNGVPAIATNVGGTSEIVNDKNGYLLGANPSSKEVANAIEGFYNLKGEVKEGKRKAAYDTWNEKYNAEKNYNEFVDDILSL